MKTINKNLFGIKKQERIGNQRAILNGNGF